MRLIDADKLIGVLHESLEGDCDLRKDYEFMGIDEFIKNQPTAYVIQEYKENLVKQLEIMKQEHKTKMQKEENETDFYSDYIVSEEHGYIMGLQEVIEMVKGGEDNANIAN